MLAIGRSTLYRRVRAGEIPKPLQIGPKSTRWREDEVLAFRDSCSVGVGRRPGA